MRNNTIKFDFHPYKRRFCQPLKTSHGIWEVREGIILRLIDEAGNVGWGEITPLPWFGSETLEQALEFCLQLRTKITEKEVKEISDSLPACQFGFESALESLAQAQRHGERGGVGAHGVRPYSYLLPAGEDVLEAWKTVVNREGTQSLFTFKWKIGVGEVKEEIRIFQKLIQALPLETKLRLDANGGLSFEQAKMWLQVTDETPIIEFIEQPLSPQAFDRMMDLSVNYSTAIALDESVSTLKQLEDCYQKGWRGIYVIKAAIAGSPQRLRRFCRQYSIDTVFSSVFETKIGREAVLRLAAELSNRNRAVGFGVTHWFEGDED
ncbi:MAG: o-succinylbenzoate synthase [Hydrococcus sp. Prado102]|jgi:O-succinylbenzoate synthase|nr:o-succinylbenzoate synthase [Hydrococcus sp. Prado102]